MESGVRMETVLKLIQRVDSRETDKKQEQEKRQLLRNSGRLRGSWPATTFGSSWSAMKI